ncbi:MAG: hypothetical protein WA485_05975 [Candidatus Sulfotelmatobacter sp.]
MRFSLVPVFLAFLLVLSLPASGSAQSDSSFSSSSRNKKTPKGSAAQSGLDAGGIVGAFYHNKTLGLSCKVPPGWVLRTEEMNARDEGDSASDKNSHISQGQGDVGHPTSQSTSPQGTQRSTGEGNGGRVLLATFSRPPEAKGEDVNGSIVIAAEPVASYPGLTEALQYLGPLEEVAKAQGFTADENPYEIAIGAKTLVREDFHKDVGSRVMRQSTMTFLAKGYAVSITVIAGTEDEVEELVDGVGLAGK